MIALITAVVGVAVALAFADPVLAQEQEYACPCKQHKAGARGPSLCSVAETEKYCEILYGLPPVLIPQDKQNLVKKLSLITKQLGRKVPFRLLAKDEKIVREVSPDQWDKIPVRDSVVNYIISISIFPLVYQKEPDSVLIEVAKTLLSNVPAILKSIGQKKVTRVGPNLTIGSGCMEAIIAGRRIFFNSGWYVKRFKEGWTCRWK